ELWLRHSAHPRFGPLGRVRRGYDRACVPRMRVLILAESCHPDWVSLPAVAYKAVRAIADLADVVLVTHVRNEPAISRQGCGRARVEYVDTEAVAAPLYRLSKVLRGGDSLSWT